MLFRTFIASLILAAGALAQMSSFPKPSYFRETFSKASTKVELKDPVRLKDFVAGGKLELSLKNYLELVMANNTDIQFQRLSLEIPKNAIQRAFGIWDPRATAQFTSTRATSPTFTTLDAKSQADVITEVKQLNQPLTMSVSQLLPAGTNYTVSWGGIKTTSSSGNNKFNPNLSSNLGVNFSQPLIRDRGGYINRLNLMIARSRLRISDYTMKNQVLNLVSAAENAYWDVVSARENLRVTEIARDAAAKFLELSQKQLELGALSRLDIYNPQQQLASREVDVAQAQFRLAQVEDALRKQMGADLDPEIRILPIVVTDPADMSTDVSFDREQSIATALANRPDLKTATQSLDVDELSITQSKNALLPNLALLGSYQSAGSNILCCVSSNVTSQNGVSSVVRTTFPGALSDSLGQLFGFGFSTYQLGLRLTLPIKNRAASADLADALVRKKQDTLTLRITQQTIRLDILNAITNLESSKKSVELAKTARDFAVKALDAENQKYELGTELQQFVINAQRDLAAAELSVVTNQVSLRRNLLNLLIKTGTLLDERGIVVQ